MEELFVSPQTTSACHQRNALLLRRLFEEDNSDVAIEKFVGIISKLFQIDYKDERKQYVERIITFLIVFFKNITENNDQMIEKHPIIDALLQFLFNAYDTIYPSYRYWSCRLFSQFTDTFTELSDDLYKKLTDAMLERVLDDKVDIRLEAIKFLYRLQDAQDSDDVITKELFNSLLDSNAKIRRFVVEKIALNNNTLVAVLDRCQDVEVNVRLAAFARISKLMQNIKIVQRRTVLYCGFNDESDKVRNFLQTTFLNNWLEMYEDNYFDLLKSIHFDDSEDNVEMTCGLFENIWKALFNNKSISELLKILPITNQQIEYDQLNFEIVLCWRILVKHLRNIDEYEDYLNLILPECVHFCKYIKNYYDYSCNIDTDPHIKQFILKQLFLITKDYDLTDNSSRQCLNLLIRFMLENVQLNVDVVEEIIENLENTILDTNKRIIFITEIISNIKYPVDDEQLKLSENETNLKRNNLEKMIRQLERQKQQFIDDNKFLEAEQIKNEIILYEQQVKHLSNADCNREINKTNDINLILRYLTIAEALLKSTKLTVFTAELKSLQENTIFDVLLCDNDEVKIKSLHCCALISLLDYKTAQYTIHILSSPIFAYQRGDDCLSEILLVCMKAVFDLIVLYGSRLIAEPNDEDSNDSNQEEHLEIFVGGTGLTALLQGIVDIIDDEQIELQEAAIEVLCKLLLNNCIQSPTIIARLILKWACPDDDKQFIKQYIGKTLNTFPSLSHCFKHFEEAILIVIETIVKAPKVSPLSAINLENTAKFMISLCQASTQGFIIQYNLIKKILDNLSYGSDKVLLNIFTKMLLWLDVPDNQQVVKELLTICKDIDKDGMNRLRKNNLTKFMDNLKSKLIEIGQE